RYARYLAEARRLAEALEGGGPSASGRLEGPLGELQYFVCPEGSVSDTTRPETRSAAASGD
ncbi:MAG TPA: hypothetical protein VE173_12825, partial [Longimicrobiales bacterium]|nr:hypothetical protein [Longimicrobiales bacterium]